MTWSGSAYPDGSEDLPTNRVGLSDNFGYLETTLQVDHHFDDSDSDKDGHHKFVAMPTQTIDVAIPTGTDAVIYPKTISGSNELFYRNSSDIYQLTPGAGMWAYAVFNATSTGTITSAKSKNVASLTRSGNIYTLTFTDAAPDANYTIGGSMHLRTDNNVESVAIQEPSSNQVAGSFKFAMIAVGGGSITASKITKAMVWAVV